jgi:PIN domain nuclease of toxin-antitoxin system
MRLLLDTHAFLWSVENSPSLSASARAAIADAGNEKLLSIASLWEIAIKVSIGKLALAKPFDELVNDLVANRLITVVPILPAHLKLVVALPHHHGDPFDRVIIAQAQHGTLTVVGNDPAFDDYDMARLW